MKSIEEWKADGPNRLAMLRYVKWITSFCEDQPIPNLWDEFESWYFKNKNMRDFSKENEDRIHRELEEEWYIATGRVWRSSNDDTPPKDSETKFQPEDSEKKFKRNIVLAWQWADYFIFDMMDNPRLTSSDFSSFEGWYYNMKKHLYEASKSVPYTSKFNVATVNLSEINPV